MNSEKNVQAGYESFMTTMIKNYFFHMDQYVLDNYDYNRRSCDSHIKRFLRFSRDGLRRLCFYLINERGLANSARLDFLIQPTYFEFFIKHSLEFNDAFQILVDVESKKLYMQLILYRMLGHVHVKIKEDYGWQQEKETLDLGRKYYKCASKLDVDGKFGKIEHHEAIPTDTDPIQIDCWTGNVVYTAIKRQYYLTRKLIKIHPSLGDVVIDTGSGFGDTAVFFAKSVGSDGHVFTFDPLPINSEVIKFNINQNHLFNNVTYVPYAVGEKSNLPIFKGKKLRSSNNISNPEFNTRNNKDEFPIISIDDYCDQQEIQSLNFLKMDIEGSELEALKGAEKSIRKFQPSLAISLYHKDEDFFSIPLWIKSNFPNYSFYLDHYTIHQEETILYGVST